VLAEQEAEEPALPTPAEVSVHAERLGMVPGEDAALLWVAEQSLCAAVPAPWRELCDHRGATFYLNNDTGESLWEHPFEEVRC
jgi:centrosomal protein CEP164